MGQLLRIAFVLRATQMESCFHSRVDTRGVSAELKNPREGIFLSMFSLKANEAKS